jgi:hypothetical protein
MGAMSSGRMSSFSCSSSNKGCSTLTVRFFHALPCAWPAIVGSCATVAKSETTRLFLRLSSFQRIAVALDCCGVCKHGILGNITLSAMRIEFVDNTARATNQLHPTQPIDTPASSQWWESTRYLTRNSGYRARNTGTGFGLLRVSCTLDVLLDDSVHHAVMGVCTAL